METLKQQHSNFNMALTALIVVPLILSLVIAVMPNPPGVLFSLVTAATIILIMLVINCSFSRHKSAKSIGEQLPAGRDRDAFLAYAASAKRCGWIVIVCWIVSYVANILLLAWGKSASFELLSLARLVIFAAILLAMIAAAINTGKHLRGLPDVDIDLPGSEAESSEGKN